MVDAYVRELFDFAVEGRHTLCLSAGFVLTTSVVGGVAPLPQVDGRCEGVSRK